MHDPVNRMGVKYRLQRIDVDQIETLKVKTRPLLQIGQTRLLETDIVIIVQVVDADDLTPLCNQSMADGCTDETSAACNQHRSRQGLLRLMTLGATGARARANKARALAYLMKL